MQCKRPPLAPSTQRHQRSDKPLQRRPTQRVQPIVADRVRAIGRGGFAFIPNRFLHDGFFAALSPDELLLYLFLIIAGDRWGMSYYHYDSLCQVLRWPVERYLCARNSLIAKDLIAFDGTRFQVLELPERAPAPRPLRSADELEEHDLATIQLRIRDSFGRGSWDDNDADTET